LSVKINFNFAFRDFYKMRENKEIYRMPPNDVLVSGYCASPFKDLWNRAFITKVLSPDKCEVFYIDYGTVEKISSDKLK
jgi:hypothetical protein